MRLNAEPPHTLVELAGIHHVSLPTADVGRSITWYVEVLGFQCLLVEEEEEAGVIGALLVHPTGAVISLHADPDRARALRGFCPVGLAVPDLAALRRWGEHLTKLNIEHSTVHPAHLGFAISVHGPDDIEIQLHTLEELSAEST